MVSTILLGLSVLALSISCIFLAKTCKNLQRQISSLRHLQDESFMVYKSLSDDLNALLQLEKELPLPIFKQFWSYKSK